MKNVYLFVVWFFAFPGLFLSLKLNAQSPLLDEKAINPPGIDKPINHQSSDSKSVFVNINPDTACVFLNETFSFEGLIEASDYVSVQWLNIIGYGYFTDELVLEAEYNPLPFDALLDGVMLMVYVFGESDMASDFVILKVVNLNAGEPASVCSGQDFQTQAEAGEYESVLWTTSGDGVFSSQSSLTPVYTPGMNDISAGLVQLTITATVGSPCFITGSSSMDLTIVSPPEIIVDIEDVEVELGQAIILSIVANNANGFQWYGPQGMIDGAVFQDLEIWEATFEHAGEYYCECYNDCGTQPGSIVTLTVYQLQALTIPAGWSGISAWISPFDTNIENLFQPVVDNLVVLENFSGIYNPGANINTLINWDSQTGYQVKVSNEVNVLFKGIDNQNQSITLQPGWNYLPVISACDVDVASVFGGISSVEQIKEIAGLKVFWPEQNITSLEVLHPGSACKIFVTSETTITFPSCIE